MFSQPINIIVIHAILQLFKFLKGDNQNNPIFTSILLTLCVFILGSNLRKKLIIVPKAKWRPKTESLWEEKNLDVDESCFDYIYQNKQGTSAK